MEKIKLGEQSFYMSQESYLNNGTPAITLYVEEDGQFEPWIDLTTNVRGASTYLEEGECIVKTWSENESYIKPLLESGWFEDTGKRVPTGFVEAQVWKILKPISGDQVEAQQ